MSVEIRTPTAAAGAAATLARTTEILLEGRVGRYPDEDLLADGRLDSPVGPLAAHDVATGAAAMLAKVVLDVETVLAISRDETLARIGLWVAGQDTTHGV
jgi:hypothetical protein